MIVMPAEMFPEVKAEGVGRTLKGANGMQVCMVVGDFQLVMGHIVAFVQHVLRTGKVHSGQT